MTKPVKSLLSFVACVLYTMMCYAQPDPVEVYENKRQKPSYLYGT